MAIHVFVVSHNHGNEISKIGSVKKIANSGLFNVCVKSNCSDPYLYEYAKKNNIHVINDCYGLGFGANNNYIFKYLEENGNVTDSDYVVIMNPDLDISSDNLMNLILEMKNNGDSIATANLFKDYEYKIYDNSIRMWPTFYDFFLSFISGKNKSILDKKLIQEATLIDWAAGSFLVFKASLYRELDGFDERYFMYCEDIDICYRAHKLGHKVKYYPNVRAVHLAAHANRNIFSKHFFWHVSSVFRFLLSTRG
ncbi:glycosyltransferase [Pectobacterium aquaticum]|uniref:Glycosyltransferase family 2 protein n=1 Tax=Pectobacterium aquaticum TaxID=2204145 RepID=A0A426IYV7_9GAMM|nr:glycosyltransferase family 2 protein [Pectobacterium aquaticum]RRO06018.1 glycosyltransferase family 2 protein [Pectobacterium aquaticum]